MKTAVTNELFESRYSPGRNIASLYLSAALTISGSEYRVQWTILEEGPPGNSRHREGSPAFIDSPQNRMSLLTELSQLSRSWYSLNPPSAYASYSAGFASIL